MKEKNKTEIKRIGKHIANMKGENSNDNSTLYYVLILLNVISVVIVFLAIYCYSRVLKQEREKEREKPNGASVIQHTTGTSNI